MCARRHGRGQRLVGGLPWFGTALNVVPSEWETLNSREKGVGVRPSKGVVE